MTVDSKMLDIIRKIGEVTPPPVRLSKLFRSPEQDFISFSLPTADMSFLALVFDLLAQSSANIRYLSQHLGGEGYPRVQMCVDSVSGADALKALQREEVVRGVGDIQHRSGVVILSLYPFGGQPHLAQRILETLRAEGIEILGAGAATSVFSCVTSCRNVETAVSRLKQAFVLP
jgi:aspartokinase